MKRICSILAIALTSLSAWADQEAYLGVETIKPGSKAREQRNLNETTGHQVTDVEAESPAAKAGLKAGDIILTVDGRKIKNATALDNIIQSVYSAGETIELTYLRDGEEQKVKATLAERQAVAAAEEPLNLNQIGQLPPQQMLEELQKMMDRMMQGPGGRAVPFGLGGGGPGMPPMVLGGGGFEFNSSVTLQINDKKVSLKSGDEEDEQVVTVEKNNKVVFKDVIVNDDISNVPEEHRDVVQQALNMQVNRPAIPGIQIVPLNGNGRLGGLQAIPIFPGSKRPGKIPLEELEAFLEGLEEDASDDQ